MHEHKSETQAVLVTQRSEAGPRLMRAAISGLLAIGVAGCPAAASETSDSDAGRPVPSDAELEALCVHMVTGAAASTQASADAMCTQEVVAIKDQCKPLLGKAEEKTTGAQQREYTFAALTRLCDERGGYVEISAHCSGTNTCRGFTYGDWGPTDATLTEHAI